MTRRAALAALLALAGAPRAAAAATTNVSIDYTGGAAGCADSTEHAPIGPQTFRDPTPPGAVVTDIAVGVRVHVPTTASARVAVQGTQVGDDALSGQCMRIGIGACVCGVGVFTSPTYADGWPGYVYGGTNRLDIDVYAGDLFLDAAVVAITYSLCGNTAVEVGEECDDGAGPDYCDGCTPGCALVPLPCDDGNQCTTDSCLPASGCEFVFNALPCDDADPCTGGDVCFGGECAGSPLPCDDGDLCTADSCGAGACINDPIAGCCNVGGDCADGDPCTMDLCSGPGGTCSNPALPGCCRDDSECADGDLCTADACSGPGGSCSNPPISNCCESDGECADGTVCTADSCDLGAHMCLHAGIPGCCSIDADCDDGDDCTADHCTAATGLCGNDAIPGCCLSAGDCDDGDPCTADACIDHACAAAAVCFDAGPIDAGATDAAPAPDGPTAAGDAGSGPDAYRGDAGVVKAEGSCACRAGGGRAPARPLLGLAVVAGLLWLRRRRRTYSTTICSRSRPPANR